MNSVASHQGASPVNDRQVELAGLEESIFLHRAGALKRIADAATEIKDQIEYHVTSSEASREAATKSFMKIAYKRHTTIGICVFSILALILVMAILSSMHFFSLPAGQIPAAVRYNAALFIAAFALYVLALPLGILCQELVNAFLGQRQCVEAFGRRGANVWGIGDKAMYVADKDNLQVIRIDALGSVKMKDLDIVLVSRFGDPSVSLECPVSERMPLEDILRDLKGRIA